MENILIALFFVFVYFLIYSVIQEWEAKRTPLKKEDFQNLSLCLMVRNSEEEIEKILHALKLEGWDMMGEENFFVVDRNSDDKTLHILRKLRHGPIRFTLLKWSEKERIFENDKNIP